MFFVKKVSFPAKTAVQGHQKNSIWNFWGLIIKNEVEFPNVTKKKPCGISRAFGHRLVTQFCGILKGGALFCPEKG